MARMKFVRKDSLADADGIKYIVIEDDGTKRYFDAAGKEITEEKEQHKFTSF